ncbi:transposase domain protein [Geobacillus kaustophilus]|uniref:Transposase domain protein n=1 Tax=Geobacillus kaustophilus TaxID=1462 RepID=A0A0D8BVI9_GEOKU|nr:transposase domain protein [Geobacillus kaustophilus]
MTWSGGRDSLFRHSQPLILLASWLFNHAPRGSMSSCHSLHFSLQNSVFFLCRKQLSRTCCSASSRHSPSVRPSRGSHGSDSTRTGSKGGCPECHLVQQAEFPFYVTNHVQYGPAITSLVLYWNHAQLIPCERVTEMIKALVDHSMSCRHSREHDEYGGSLW